MNAFRSYFRTVWRAVYSIAIGLRTTFPHLFTRSVTLQYPDEKLQLTERARNRLYVNIDDCIGCDQCSLACPVDCITIETIKSTPDQNLGVTSTGHKKRLHVPRFDIDIAKCCYCGLCVYPCPTECIVMTDVYEFAEYDRRNLIFNYSSMLPHEIDDARAKLKKAEEEAAAKKAAAAAKTTPPAGAQTPQGQPPSQPQKPDSQGS